jgi:hypothetical protein
MTSLLISVILAGSATTFIVEFVALWATLFFKKESIYVALSLPLSYGALYLLGCSGKSLGVSIPASAFVALMLNKYLNKPTPSTFQRLPRL